MRALVLKSLCALRCGRGRRITAANPIRSSRGLAASLGILRLVVALAPVVWAQAPSQADQVRRLNQEILKLHGALRGPDLGRQQELSRKAEELIAERAKRLAALMEEDPGQALSLAFPPDTLMQLEQELPRAAAQLESQGTWEGRIQRAPGSPRSQILLHGADTSLELHLVEPLAPGLRNGDMVSITGIRLGRGIAAVDTTTEIAASGTSGSHPQSAICDVRSPDSVPIPISSRAGGCERELPRSPERSRQAAIHRPAIAGAERKPALFCS
jgi:hypothetical protein